MKTGVYTIDVREPIDAFTKFTLENEFQPISSGGCISYVEVPNLKNNLKALKNVIRFIYDNVQYGEINTRSDICHKCGFEGEIRANKDGIWECPNCHNTDFNEMTVTRRTCGYIGSNGWNVGKVKEINSRVLHL